MVAPGAQGLEFVAEEGKKWTQRWNASDDDGHIFLDTEKVISCWWWLMKGRRTQQVGCC